MRYLLTRLGQAVGVLLALSFLVFSLLYLAPGDLAKNLIGTRKATPEALAAISQKYHLDEPFFAQYWRWLQGVLHGDFGDSIRSGVPVADVLGQRIPVTISLTVIAFAFAVGIGIPLGFIAAHRIGSLTDRTIVGVALVGVSAPSFALALVFLYLFSVMLDWFPVYGMGDGFWDQMWHLVLPSLAIAVGTAAMIIKVTRTSVAREVGQDYVMFATSRGIGRQRIAGLYMKNAAIPIITSSGLILASLFGSTVLIETTFALPGIGQLLADSITFKDVPVVQAVTMLVAVVIVTAMFLVDLAAAVLNPALRTHSRSQEVIAS
ncbi:ABC transporter permease [Changpingibacter yushuensis]|uniref:ABC transporter permease n=1 Tax=Changpingibacter yushuensis TaxID=2758440 RepID=UPI0015F59B9F|nr:ABC transporter permease [Changpingibacter yushuensis]